MKRIAIGVVMFVASFTASARVFSPGMLTSMAMAAAEKVDRRTSAYPEHIIAGLYVGPEGTSNPASSTANKITRVFAASSTIDFASTSTGVVLSASITVTGARAGDPCFVGVPTAAAALKATFGCYVDATNSVKVWFQPQNITFGSVALSSASPSTATVAVPASSVCSCSPLGASAAIAAAGCATGVSSTTLTLTGPNTVTTTMAYFCAAPVDPASGTYYVRVVSSQA